MMTKRVSKPTYKKFIVEELKRFDEADHVYSRVDRGEVIPQEMVPQGDSSRSAVHQLFNYDPDRKNKHGYSRTDYALRWSGRTIDYVARRTQYGRENPPKPPPVKIDSAERMTDLIKKTGRWFGADLVGVARLDRTWVFSRLGDHSVQLGLGGKVGDPIELPEYFTNVIVIATEMSYEHVQRSPAMDSSADLGYSRMGFVASSLARFIQELGYHAMPSGNDTALTIPMAVDAGLGELGRNGMLITEKYGPRVRLCKVFTDLPLVHDAPVDLGVQAYCEVCEKCAEFCPGQALKYGERTAEHNNISNSSGLLKWPVNAEKCVTFWAKQRCHCSTCIRVCPYNKPDTWFHDVARWHVGHLPQFNRFYVWMDDVMGYGKQILGDPRDEFFD
jgi:epoxyqueuosine reductase